MNILGISAYYHDSASAIICDGKIIAAAQEERFSRIKHDPSFPSNAIKFCLHYAGLTIDELDAVVFYDKPLLKFERLLETYFSISPKGFISFVSSIPIWLKEKLFLKKIIKQELSKIEKYKKSKLKLLFTEHHLSHAASAYFPSPYNEAAIITIDGVGEWATASICKATGNSIEMLQEMKFPHSLGLLYSSFTYFLGFKVNSGEYKLMGLAPFGNAKSNSTLNFIKIIRNTLVDIKEDGSLSLNMNYFRFDTGIKMIDDNKWQNIFGIIRRLPETEILQIHCNLAYAIQFITDEIVLRLAATAKQITGCENLCLAGGVALNCVSNSVILKSGLFKNIYIQPAAGDAGGALGAALAVYYIYYNSKREILKKNYFDHMNGSYLGPEFSDLDIELIAKKFKTSYENYENIDELIDKTATLLSNGNVIGWFQGRMEFGPRALGNRSIIGDARSPDMQKKLNLKIKKRESFRPFAPSVNEEFASEYFDIKTSSPYMLFVANIVKKKQIILPENYDSLPLLQRLYTERSSITAVTHVDFSSRIQTVSKLTNSRYWKLIKRFKEKTNFAVIVNTSFNIRGEPIVCTPEQAYICFMRTEMDFLVMGNFIFDKKNQPEWKENSIWKNMIKSD